MQLDRYPDCKQPPREAFSQLQLPKPPEVTIVMAQERQATSQGGNGTWQHRPSGFADMKNLRVRGYGASNGCQKVVLKQLLDQEIGSRAGFSTGRS